MPQCIIRFLGSVPYLPYWQKMLDFTQNRNNETADEIWLLEHPPVFTQGKAGKPEHLFDAKNIDLVHSDRGGQITYHGPGQLVCYVLLDLKRLNIGIKKLVSILEDTLIQLLKQYNIPAQTIDKSPGVYIDCSKIASLGLRVRKNCTLHGLSLNIQMDLSPFSQIRPCGLNNIQVTDMSYFIKKPNFNEIQQRLSLLLSQSLGYNHHEIHFVTKP